MAIGDIIQTGTPAGSGSGGPYVPTLGSAATIGNLLVAFGAITIGGRTATTPAGWTAGPAQDVGGNLSSHIFWKESDGTETDVTITLSGSGGGYYNIMEFDGSGLNLSAIDASAEDETNIATAVASQSTGTAAGTATSGLALGLFGFDIGGNVSTGRAFTNGFAEIDTSDVANTSRGGYSLASKVITGNSNETTFSHTETNEEMYGAMLVFGSSVDTAAPTFDTAPSITAISHEGGTAGSVINETGDTYFVIVPDGATAPTPTEVIAGTGSGGSGQLVAGSSLAGTTLSQAFTGLSESTPYDAYFIARDDEGTPNAQAAVTKVDFTTTALVMTADSVTAGPHYVGNTVTIQLSNATNATGKTLSCSAGAITATAQDINSISFSVFDLKIFGTKTLNYNEDIAVTVTDAGESDSINFQIAPTIGYDFAEITDVDGIYADDVTVAIGDHGYGTFVTGTGTVDVPTGNFTVDVHSTYRYWVKDATDGVWSDSVIETFEDPTGTYVVVGPSVDETDGSVFYNYVGQTPSFGDTIIHDPVTSPSGIAVTVLDSGIWQLASMPTVDQTFDAYVLHGDNTYGTKGTFTFVAPDLVGPTLTLPTDTSTGETTGSGTVTTNDATGTLYYLASTNSTENIATIKTGSSQAVTATGIQNVVFTGLTGGTTYYAHFVHTDASGNNSNVSNAAGFLTDAAPDTTAPVLTSPTGTKTGQVTAAGSVVTDEAGGTLYYVITANSSEVAATVLAGEQQAVLATGIQNVVINGLTPGGSYYIHYLQVDASANESNVVSSAQFTTDSAIGLVISGTSTIRLGEVFTITTTGTYDLTAAVSITATLGGVTLTGLANVTSATCDFTCPATGLSLVSPSDLIMTINI